MNKSIIKIAISICGIASLVGCGSTQSTSSSTSQEEKKLTVSLYVNGGTMPEGSQTSYAVSYGDTIDFPLPNRDNYTFMGWVTGETANDKKYTSYDPIYKDLELYAKWELHNYPTSLGDSFLLGEYPQTLIEDENLISRLEKISTLDSNGYINLLGRKFKKTTAELATDKPELVYVSRSGKTTFATGTTYYFEVEPIQWRVMSGKNLKTGFLMSEYVLGNSPFNDLRSDREIDGQIIHANNYKYSYLRNYLTSTFYNLVFSSSEKKVITLTNVDNSKETATQTSGENQYACDNTSDYIFAMSYAEGSSEQYNLTTNELRQAYATDYARATGCLCNDGISTYWTRSPDPEHADNSSYWNYDGGIYGHGVGIESGGIRPGINIDIS